MAQAFYASCGQTWDKGAEDNFSQTFNFRENCPYHVSFNLTFNQCNTNATMWYKNDFNFPVGVRIWDALDSRHDWDIRARVSDHLHHEQVLQKKNTRQNKRKIFWTPKSLWVGFSISFKSNHHFLKGTNILSYSGSPSPSPGVRSSVAGSLKHLSLDIKYVEHFWLGYVTFESLCQNTHYGSQTIRILTSAECTWACILWLTLLEAFWLPLVFSFFSYH